MKITSVRIQNFRLLEDCDVRLDDLTTVLVGKNNAGKTSFFYVIQSFLDNKKFKFEDFSISCHSQFIESYKEYVLIKENDEKLEDYFKDIDLKIPSIKLKLEIEYGSDDNWGNIRSLLTSLDSSNKLQILFSYEIKEPRAFLDKLYLEIQKMKGKKKEDKSKIIEVVSRISSDYFDISIKPFFDGVQTEEIKYTDISKLVGSHFIAAQRNVEDSNSKTNSKLAPVFQREYKISEQRQNRDGNADLENLNVEMENANAKIDAKLADFFKNFTESFSTFGYPNIEGVEIILKSNVTPTNLFNGIQLFYKDKEYLLPEKYNGLGYSNLLYIISEILSFKSKIDENPTDLNLIFIEEPEAHMHPQLQNTFILKLNEFLKKNNISAQVIISTHSSHIVSNAQFESIRYLGRENQNVDIKDLLEFKIEVESKLKQNKDGEDDKNEFDHDTIQFLKKYITLVKCDMFFADKIILVEGLCERLLMPLFIEKVDQILLGNRKYKGIKPLSEQYIAIIEIGGAYMHKFKEFLEFLNIKTLVITDIDSCIEQIKVDSNGSTVYLKDNITPKVTTTAYPIVKKELSKTFTSNQTLIKWMPQKCKISELIFEKLNEKSLTSIAVTYQKNYYKNKSNIKCGRSFEEAFIIDNSEYIFNHKNSLFSIKNTLKNYESKDEIFDDSYEIYNIIDKYNKKSDFAFDLMYVSPNDWKTPTYIEEGLLWLAR